MNQSNPLLRFSVGLVAAAFALRLTWELLQPIVPAIVAVLAALSFWRLIFWHRNRW
jgi:hypothetical protein